MDSAEEPRHVLQVKQYLIAPFPSTAHENVDGAVAQPYEQFDDNHIRDSVPLLVERRANKP
ncbi:three-helix bundle dimerization domain-containing protein [Rhodococcus sp. UFZ-B548]|uniref:three-helix bundle dimerization domain-containing protein n=1 Tax=Rhodococcus sp. UFZ-B548 TaxID=2742212 RepID=UPI0037CC8EFF